MLCVRMDELFAALGITVYKSQKLFSGCCPVHGGNNPGALNVYRKGDTRPGFWTCNSRHCHRKTDRGGFGATILGFVRGVLSHQKYNWQGPESTKKASWTETIDWCTDFIGVPLQDISADHEEFEKLKFNAGINVITRIPEQEVKGVPRQSVRSFLEIPAAYYRERGYSSEILDRYDVGFYPAAGRELSGRIAVPIYDNKHRVAVGFTARSIFEKCGKCQRWHDPKQSCPVTSHEINRTSKWHNNFKKEHYLYNFWYAAEHVLRTRTIVLCEGPGDIWRLEEAGIHVGLAMLGSKLSDQQQVIIEKSGASNIVVLTDSDQAGDEARKQIKERLGNLCKLHFPVLQTKDVGEMAIEAVAASLNPLLEKIFQRGY